MFTNLIKGITCVFGGFLINFSLGTFYTFGNMIPYMASYMRIRTADNWVTPGHLVWIFSMVVLFQGGMMAVGGILEKKIGTRLTCLLGGWTMSLSTILTFFTIQNSIWGVIVTYGIFFGIGTGLTYSVSIAAPMRWFPQRKGLVVGAVVAGYGLGSLFFNIIQTKFINPLNVSPTSNIRNNSVANVAMSEDKYFYDKDVLDKVPWCFLITGCSYAVIQLIGVLLLINPSSKIISGEEQTLVQGNKMDDDQYSSNKAYESAENEAIEDSENIYSVTDAVKTKRFWILWSTIFMNGIVIISISSLYKAFGQQFLNDDQYFAVVGAVAAVFNSGGRLFWGQLLDRFSFRVVMTALTMSMAVLMGSFYFCSQVSSVTGAKAMYTLWVWLLFFCLAGSFAAFPTATAHSFGSKNVAIIYGLVFAGYSCSSIVGAVMCSMLLKIVHYGGLFTLATIAAMISLLITQFYGPFRLDLEVRKT